MMNKEEVIYMRIKEIILTSYIAYIIIMSVISFIIYKIDKVKAKNKKWRIKESTLIGFGFFGGALGALTAMKLFHHKTKHWYFWAVNIAGILFQIGLAIFLMNVL